MENKKLGAILMITGIVILSVFIYFNKEITRQGNEAGCFSSEKCQQIENTLSFIHIGIGIFSFMLALGFYLIFFNKTEEHILRRLEEEKEKNISEAKFEMLLKALDPFEQKVVKIVREESGITQSTLRIKTDMSKAKLSYVLQELEKRQIIKRVKKGKTLAIYLRV